MDYLRNHCWCSNSHWDNEHFNCQIIVGLSSYQEDYKEDYDKLTQVVEVFSQQKLDEFNERVIGLKAKFPESFDDAYIKRAQEFEGKGKTTQLKPEVMKWLTDNVPDINGEKGWCVGSDYYNMSDGCGFSIFMQRRKDAMLFIKTWSKWKKPIRYTQYFTDVRKTLDLKTLKYVDR